VCPHSFGHLPRRLCALQLSSKERNTKTSSPLPLTGPSVSETSDSGGGVSVSTESTDASWGDVFSVPGICSSEGGVAAISSGGGVCISGSKSTDGWSCALLSDSGGSDMAKMG